MREMNERLIATAEVVERHFAEAVEIKRQLDDLIAALGAAAERAALEAPPPRFEHRAVEVLDVGVE
jgi:hypothetical protein